MTAYIAPAIFLLLWGLHNWFVEHSQWRRRTLTYGMEQARLTWIRMAAERSLRMPDTAIINGLQNGATFFTSTSLLAIGAAYTLLLSTDQLVEITAGLPVMIEDDGAPLELKATGLILIYAYAFLKFGWSYRLFNYTSILIGAMPPAPEADDESGSDPALENAIRRAGEMSIHAAKEFNRGQRAFFIAIGYLGWFAGDLVFLITATAMFAMMISRQFLSPARLTALS